MNIQELEENIQNISEEMVLLEEALSQVKEEMKRIKEEEQNKRVQEGYMESLRNNNNKSNKNFNYSEILNKCGIETY